MDEKAVTNNLWDDYKNISLATAENIIKNNLNGCARNFVAIGFYLKDIRDNETYLSGGYDSIWDFAKDRLQMAKSTVSRFIAINDRFSVNGNTPVLMDKYLDFGSGKLQEMLTMTDEEIANISVNTTVKEIREIKKSRCDAQQETEIEKPLTIDNLDLSVSAYNALHKHGVDTIEKLCEYTEQELLDFKIGDYYVKQIMTELEKIGWSLKECDGGQFGGQIIKSSITDIFPETKAADVVPTFIKDGDPYGWTRSEIINSLIKEMIKDDMTIDELKDGTEELFHCLGKTYVACGFDNEYITLQNDDCESLFKTSIERFQDEFEWYKNNSMEQNNAQKEATCDGNCFYCKNEDCNCSQEKRTSCIYDTEKKCNLYNAHEVALNLGVNCISSCCNLCNESCGARCNRSAHQGVSDLEDKKPEVGTIIYCVGGNSKIKRLEVVSKQSDISKDYFSVKDMSGAVSHISVMSEHWYYTNDDAKKDSWYDDETVEADIIHMLPEDDAEEDEETEDVDPEQYTYQDVDEELDKLMEYIQVFREDNNTAPGRRKTKMRLDAIILLDKEMRKPPVVEEPKPIQPELPILKNNDQRKEWAENYKAWGEWYYDENIDCHYYKYDFFNGDRLIVEEYRDREVYWNNEKRDENHYHLLRKEKESYGGKRTYEEKYSHQTSSMSEIVEYLKEIQKKG